MSQGGGTRSSKLARRPQHGGVLLGLAGGMLVVAAGFMGGYYVLGTRSEANAATVPATRAEPIKTTAAPIGSLDALLAQQVEIQLAVGAEKVSLDRITWAELGLAVDADEAKRVASTDLKALAAKGSLPLSLDRDKAVAALLKLKAKHDRAPVNAYLDLEARLIHDDRPGQGIDVFGSLPRIAAAARSAAPSIQLLAVAMPAMVTKATIGIDDISAVLGHYETKFAVTDKVDGCGGVGVTQECLAVIPANSLSFSGLRSGSARAASLVIIQ